MATALSDKQRNTIITMALRKAGVIAEAETPSASQFTHVDLLLNILVKSLDAVPALRFKEALAVKSISWSSATAAQALAAGVQRVDSAYFVVTATSERIPMKIISRQQLSEAAAYGESDTPEFLYVSPHGTGATTVTATLYPTPNANGTLYYWSRDLIDIFDNSTDPADIPDHMIRWLVYELTYDVAWDYGKNLEDIDRLKAKADDLWNMIVSGVEGQAIRMDVSDQPNDQNSKQV